ncbi:hypothetical protein CEP54_002696 [Fusarium duplospermum]|uniref:Uncharacterized protein n=1 Tax=Fusarium duplospermum TaxID=1325734 RepID=A0A428QTF7_9HYPO|nr:hypothetical protein CEP54_002696 [Fusarium duplospermum]
MLDEVTKTTSNARNQTTNHNHHHEVHHHLRRRSPHPHRLSQVPLPPPRPLLEGTVNSDRDCKKSITKWTIDENAHDRCVIFDEELEGVEDYAVKSLRVDALNNDKCGLWVYSDHGCHMAARRVEPKTCVVADRWGWRSYAIFCL